MRGMIASVLVLVALGVFTVAAAQLPPEIMMDRHLLQAEQLMAEEDYEAALDEMNKIVALQREHDLALPDAFHFKYAQAAFSAGSVQAAIDSLNQYLAASGRDGEFYREALELLIEAEPIQTQLDEYSAQVEQLMAEDAYDAALELMDTVVALHEEHNVAVPDRLRSERAQVALFAQTCAGQPEGAACWLELASQPGCYVWDDFFYTDQTVTWTGECSHGLAQGTGTLAWDTGSVEHSYGPLQDGKKHGDWVVRYAYGSEEEGPYVEGQRHGRWVERYAGKVEEGPYVEGKRHGRWVERFEDGTVFERPYVEGELRGHLVWRNVDGSVREEGPIVDGKKHGQWVEPFGSGPYVEGQRHGRWVERSMGRVSEGPYVEDQRHGHWVEDHTGSGGADDKEIWEGPYVEGQRHGRWVERSVGGRQVVVWEGPYVEGKRHGQWVGTIDGDVGTRVTFRNGNRIN